ncbi:MAG: cysteine hydrolase [Granulosicoccus sp.]|nr:cysteine hydrolase [Granulosicoccus sp.]
MKDLVILALHYQNENCHEDGKIKVGIKQDADWRYDTLDAAKRLFAGARKAGVEIVHVRLAVRPDHRDVIPNNFIFKQWVELGAWAEGSWGVEFFDGLQPTENEYVVTHTRNNAFYNSQLDEVMALLKPKTLAIAGVSTAYVVETTARHAADVGYDTLVVADACSTATREMHNNALAAMELIASITTVDKLIDSLAQ